MCDFSCKGVMIKISKINYDKRRDDTAVKEEIIDREYEYDCSIWKIV